MSQTGKWLTAIALVTALGIAVFSPALTAPAYAKPSNHPAPHGKAFGKTKHPLLSPGWMLNVSATGQAFNTTDRSKTATASLTLLTKVLKGTPGGARLEVTSGRLTVGGTIYTVQEGRGRLSMRSDKMVLHVVVQAPDSTLLHLILKARLSASLPSPFNVGDIMALAFEDPQSKLAQHWFLDLAGTLKRTA